MGNLNDFFARLWLRGPTRSSGFEMRLALVAASMLAALFLAPQGAVAQAPYEPNDVIADAAGPLLAGQSYSAAIETASDLDEFYFYVTAPGNTKAELTVQNLGGGSAQSDLDARILDASGTLLVGQAFIRDGEARVVTAPLGPQKYFIEIAAGEGYGDSYRITAGGGKGAFGPFEQIAGRCTGANTAVSKEQAKLSRARSKLQRTTARLRRSRYALPQARRNAQIENRQARARVRTARQGLDQARESRSPWCFIAP
jgi:hypothetical protein